MAEAVSAALDVGYRLIDTGAFYRNERAIGRAIASHLVDREQIFITTKVWNDDIAAGPEVTRAAAEASLEHLGIKLVDLLLLHWPVPGYMQAWQVLEEMYRQGKARANSSLPASKPLHNSSWRLTTYRVTVCVQAGIPASIRE